VFSIRRARPAAQAFWPTITAKPVWVEFLPAVVVANGT
jgi:hypothetical protein